MVVDELLLAYEEGNEVEVAWRLVRREASETLAPAQLHHHPPCGERRHRPAADGER
ncbi:hypothetical protein ACH492_36680 [Streptomyces sp. NPDC019443]|uniref:hypothetical protein n=1 Tax=Streptomyces sp. NPDC019443 TaxID=3365061 RepID=UPI0037A09012